VAPGLLLSRVVTRLNREQVIRHLGDVDDLTIARIVGTGASEADLVEAIRQVEREVELGAPSPPLEGTAAARVRLILYELAEDELERQEQAYD
jgi:hypothetical protein